MDDLIKQLKEYIAAKGLKQHELARKLGTTESNVSKWLNGRHKISRAWGELIRQKLELD